MKKFNLLSGNIKTIRAKNKLTQAEFAKAINVNRSMIGFYENGNNTPTLEVLIEICSKFKVKLDDLVNGVIARVDKPNSEPSKLPLCAVSISAETYLSQWAFANEVVYNEDKEYSEREVVLLMNGYAGIKNEKQLNVAYVGAAVGGCPYRVQNDCRFTGECFDEKCNIRAKPPTEC